MYGTNYERDKQIYCSFILHKFIMTNPHKQNKKKLSYRSHFASDCGHTSQDVTAIVFLFSSDTLTHIPRK